MTTLPPNPAVFSRGRAAAPSDAVHLYPLSDLDIATEAAARRELSAACADRGRHRLVVIVGHPDWFVDLRGLTVIIRAARQARDRGRELVVMSPPYSLQRLVEVLGETEVRFVTSPEELAG